MKAPDTARCPHCFGATKTTPCPHCGWQPGQDNPPPALALGRILDGRYRVGRVLGHGGFGITYLAWDDNLHLRLAIKEYFPRDSAGRGADGVSLAVYSGQAGDQFTYGLDLFLEEARTLAHFDQHPGIVTVKNFFRAHGTGYCVMDYVEGITLRQYLDQQPGGRISVEDALKLLTPVMDALRAVHKEGLLHRDLAPDNIYLTQDGRIKLLDFGAARFAASEHSKSLSIILKPGYAPEEQYRTRGQQGPWTDIYGLAATLYRAITGQVPPESLDRLDNDDLVPPSRLGIAITPGQEATLLQALAVKAGQRFQSMAELQQAWRSGGAASQPGDNLSGPVRPEAENTPTPKPEKRPKSKLVLALGAGLLILATIALVPLHWPGTTQPTPPQGGGTSPPITPPAPAALPVTSRGQTPATSEEHKASPPTETIKAPAESSVPVTPTVPLSTATPATAMPNTAEDSGGSNKAKQRDTTEPPGDTSSNERYRFLGNDQGIVEDKLTKLQWQRCSLGQVWNGTTCAGEATKYKWDEARRVAPAGWRLPTKEELASLVYCSSGQPTYWKTASKSCAGAYSQPTIWNAAFPNTPKNWFWSSSQDADRSDRTWGVSFNDGDVYGYSKLSQRYVRLVRGVPSADEQVGVTPLDPADANERYRFLGKDQDIVEDTRTKLQWQRCSLGQVWNGTTCAGEATKYKWGDAKRIAPAGWRLPTKEELASLVYCSSGEPAYWRTASEPCRGAYSKPTIWSAVFPNTPESGFWSSSTSASYADFAWLVNFAYGYDGDNHKYVGYPVRLVGGGTVTSERATSTSATHPSPPVQANTPVPDLVPPTPGEKAPLYYAAESAPTANIPPEAPLCYKFMVAGTEEQLRKLKAKYPGLYDDQITTNPAGGKNLMAKRRDENGKEITYFYSTSPEVCGAYQQVHLQTPAPLEERAGASAATPSGRAMASAGSDSPNERYRFLGKDQDIVEDTRTKLQWQRCSLGQVWNGTTCAGEATKYVWDEAQRITPAGWRLPTKEELASLVYCSSGEPAYWKTASESCAGAYSQPTIWNAAFPNTPTTGFGFWSSSPSASFSNNAWYVYFSNGCVYSNIKYGQEYVRLVRGGQ